MKMPRNKRKQKGKVVKPPQSQPVKKAQPIPQESKKQPEKVACPPPPSTNGNAHLEPSSGKVSGKPPKTVRIPLGEGIILKATPVPVATLKEQNLRNSSGGSADSSGIGGSGGTSPTGSISPPPNGEGKFTVNLELVKAKPHLRSRHCSCPCCGEIFVDVERVDETDDEDDEEEDLEEELEEEDYYSDGDSEDEEDEDEEEDRRASDSNLLMRDAKAKIVMQKNNRFYNKILTTQKIIREQQLIVLQRANDLNNNFCRNMECIMKLGFCPMVLQQRTDNLSKGLLEVHKLIQNWDDRLEKLIPAPRSKPGQDAKTILPSLLQVFRDKYGSNIEAMTDVQFENALKKSLADMPDMFPDEESVREALERMDLPMLEAEWENFETTVESQLLRLECEFIELSVEFGIRTDLPKIQGYEWSHAVGNAPFHKRQWARRSGPPPKCPESPKETNNEF